MYTLLPPMEPQKRAETVLPNTELPLTKNQLVQDYLLTTSSKKDNYYIDINPKPTYVLSAPVQKAKPVKDRFPAAKPPQIVQKFKTSDTQTLPNYEDHDYSSRKPKKIVTSHKTKASSPKTEKRIVQAEKKETQSESGKNPKLEEIRFIKNSFGKQIIAKYHNSNSDHNGEDNLIIVWNHHNKPQVLTYRGKDPKRYAMVHCSVPHEKSAFRVHDFTKSIAMKCKRGGYEKKSSKKRKRRG